MPLQVLDKQQIGVWKQVEHRLHYYLARLSFGASLRIDLYRSLKLLLNNQVRLTEALKTLYTIYSENGKKPQSPLPLIIADCLQGMNNGMTCTSVLAHWVPVEEGMLLQAGENAGTLEQAFEEIEHTMQAKKRIISAISGALSYPGLLLLISGFLLQMIASKVVPSLAQVVAPEQWVGAAQLLYQIAQAVDAYGFYGLILLGLLICCIAASLRFLQGPLRIWLDLIPPWSIYRLMYGSTFLLILASLIKSGIRLNTALAQLAVRSNPWLQKRIYAALSGLAAGKNLGESLQDSGYHFPDKRANRFLAVIAGYSGLDKALTVFGKSWLAEAIERIEKFAKLVMGIGLFLVGGLMILVIAGVGGMQEALQSMSM